MPLGGTILPVPLTYSKSYRFDWQGVNVCHIPNSTRLVNQKPQLVSTDNYIILGSWLWSIEEHVAACWMHLKTFDTPHSLGNDLGFSNGYGGEKVDRDCRDVPRGHPSELEQLWKLNSCICYYVKQQASQGLIPIFPFCSLLHVLYAIVSLWLNCVTYYVLIWTGLWLSKLEYVDCKLLIKILIFTLEVSVAGDCVK